MKKKWILFLFTVLVLCVLVGLGTFRLASGQRPFADITAEDIAQARVEMLPPGKSAKLDQEAVRELAGILRVATVYQKDDSYLDDSGQAAIYSIERADGSEVELMAYSPYLVVDGVGYRARLEPCLALVALGNEAVEETDITENP